jgi:hypothetical protein
MDLEPSLLLHGMDPVPGGRHLVCVLLLRTRAPGCSATAKNNLRPSLERSFTMKRIMSVALVVAILLAGERRAQAPVGPAILMVSCVLAASTFIIWVWKTVDAPKKRCIVLQRSVGDGWLSLCTNIMIVPQQMQRAFPAFGDDLTFDGKTHTYRVVEIPMPDGTGLIVTHAPGAHTWAYVYP